MCIVAKYDPASFVKAVREQGISLMYGVPTTYQRLLEYKAVAGLDTLRAAACAAFMSPARRSIPP